MIDSFTQCGTILSYSPQEVLIGWGSRHWTESCNVAVVPTFYFPDFFLKNKSPYFVHQYWKIINKAELLTALNQAKSIQPSCQWHCDHTHHFHEAFHDIQSKIEDKQIQKAVPYVFFISASQVNEQNIVHMLKSLLGYAQKTSATLYGFWDHSEGILGATPELLFDLKQPHLLETVACAGTFPADSNATPEPDTKLMEEHQLVVQGILEELAPFGETIAKPCTTLKLPHLSHLLTPISLQLKRSFDFDKIVKALHPTPSLGGYPKKETMKWLCNLDRKVNRNRFGAPAGFIHQERSSCYVAIRNIQWDREKISMGAGCGIVRESILEEEWKEIELKIRAIKGMLSI